MTTTLSITESKAFETMGAFCQQVLFPGVNVVQGQGNYVPPPNEDDYVVMWPISRRRLATNVTDYAPPTDPIPALGGKTVKASTEVMIQLDFHGVNCADNTQIFTTLFRDPFAVGFFEASGYTPLYCDDGQQLPFSTGENTFENRWTLYARLQATPGVSTTQQFADNLDTTIISVDADYPPEG